MSFGEHERQVGICKDQRDSNHGIIQLKESQEVCSSISCSKRSQLWDHTMILRASFSWVFKISKDGNCKTSLGSFFLCLTVSMGKDFH